MHARRRLFQVYRSPALQLGCHMSQFLNPPHPFPMLPQPGDAAKEWQACGAAAAEFSLQSVLTSAAPLYKELANSSGLHRLFNDCGLRLIRCGRVCRLQEPSLAAAQAMCMPSAACTTLHHHIPCLAAVRILVYSGSADACVTPSPPRFLLCSRPHTGVQRQR